MSVTDVQPEPADPAFPHGNTFRGKGVDDSWKKIQERTFTNWMNDRLRGNLKVAKKQVSAHRAPNSVGYSRDLLPPRSRGKSTVVFS